jgi:hypothetical protein
MNKNAESSLTGAAFYNKLNSLAEISFSGKN